MHASAVETGDLKANSAVPRAPGARLVSLDVYRGLTVAGMILVTDPGTYSAVYGPLLHAQWNHPTPTDMIFPSFLFIAGVALTLSFAARIERGFDRGKLALHLLRRSALILLIGVVLNGFPDYHWHTLRLPGVLQRIGICYLCGGLLYLACCRPEGSAEQSRSGNRAIAAVIVTILGVYWALLKYVPAPGFGPGVLDTRGNLPAYVDRAVFGTNHMWAWGLTPGYGVTFDPEGLLSTLPAIATLLIGVLAGEWMRSAHSVGRKIGGLAFVGTGLLLVAWLLHPLMPLNKKLWTSTFVLESGGVSLLAFACLYWVVDVRRWRRWTAPALVLGTNAILAFAISGAITTMTDRIHGSLAGEASLTLHQWVYRFGFASWLRPVNASLAYAVLIVGLNAAILWPLYRRKMFLRV